MSSGILINRLLPTYSRKSLWNNKTITETLILSMFLNVYRKVACEELSLECNFTMGRASSNNIDIASSDLSFDNLGTKNSMSKEKDQTTCHRHTASSLRGCAKKG